MKECGDYIYSLYVCILLNLLGVAFSIILIALFNVNELGHKVKFIIIIIIIIWEFFTTELDDGFSLEFEWQQVSFNLQNPSQFSVRS